MLAIPDATVHVTKLADWLELNALSSPDGRIGFGALISAMDLSAEGQSEDIAEDDTSNEALVLSAQNEIRRRRRLIGPDYPFRIAETGQSMHVVADISDPGGAYLLCLFLSHANDRTIVPKKLAPKITDKVRDFFQACATVAAGGYVQGTAISFGWPRPNGARFLQALHRTISCSVMAHPADVRGSLLPSLSKITASTSSRGGLPQMTCQAHITCSVRLLLAKTGSARA